MLLVMWSPVAVFHVFCLHTHRTQATVRTFVYTFIIIHVTIYMCAIYKIVHFHVSIVTICVSPKCMYILLQLYEDMLCISTWHLYEH